MFILMLEICSKINLRAKMMALLAPALLFGCVSSTISPEVREFVAPTEWQNTDTIGEVESNWLTQFGSPALEQLAEEALQNNFQLAQQALQVDIARRNLTVTGADRFPQLTISSSGSRRKTIIEQNGESINENYDATANLDWEIDIWGKLNDAQRQAKLSLAAREAQYVDGRLQLAADVTRTWFGMLQAQQLATLFTQRVENLVQALDIIQRGYRQGINEALDVYLAQNTLEQERARLSQQQQILLDETSSLQLLLARYPNGQMAISDELPLLESSITVGVPSELLTRRPDIREAWLDLLAADAAVAVAHKQRFPRVSLISSASDSSSELNDLLDGGSLAWSILGNISLPIFNAGRLRALEDQARMRVEQAEKAYLDSLYHAFAEVETSLNRHVTLRQRYQSFLKAEENAAAALDLAFDQYQRGLVSFTAVLESQRRAYDAQSSVIELRGQLLQNRATLYAAVGGDFTATP